MEANSIIQRWDDLVFEHRNKLYGAYLLRRLYPNRVLAGLIATLVVVVVILSVERGPAGTGAPPPKPPIFGQGTIIITPPPSIEQKKRIKPQVVPPKRTKTSNAPIVVTREEVVETREVEAIEEFLSDSDLDFGDVAPISGNADVGAIKLPGPLPGVEEPLNAAEVMPSYAGGMEAMIRFLQKKIRYPRVPRALGIEGTVYVRFIVNGDGSVSDVEVIRGIHRDCDREAIRVVSMLPDWNGGKHNGRPVRVRMVIPIKFSLERQ